jgi:hypothetical protein
MKGVHSISAYTIVDRNVIRIECDGQVSESVVDNLITCPWGYQERLDKLPLLEPFQTMESNIYWFENANGGQRCCATLGNGLPLTFYVATKAVKCVADMVLRAGVFSDGKWVFTETNCKVSLLFLEFESLNWCMHTNQITFVVTFTYSACLVFFKF